ncbi:MAG TPA: hypothetical protein VET45_04175 [Candidatus Binatia bacterium]|nr:hypothetical protein [Candidatus Binatia bacterium]
MAKRLPVALAVLIVAILLAGLEPAGAQDRARRFDGRVQWVAGQVMVVQLDNGLSVSVDLLRVPQDQYAALVQGERVLVIGLVTDSSRRVTATRVVRGDQQSP